MTESFTQFIKISCHRTHSSSASSFTSTVLISIGLICCHHCQQKIITTPIVEHNPKPVSQRGSILHNTKRPDMKFHILLFASVLSAIGGAFAFVPASHDTSLSFRGSSFSLARESDLVIPSSTALASDKKKKGGLDESLRNKLVTESIAPWRTLRLFLYGSAGSGAFIGGLINGSGAIANSNSPDFSLNTEVRWSVK